MEQSKDTPNNKTCKQCGQAYTSSEQSDYCDNCFAYNFGDYEDDDNEFIPCSLCDGHPACEDFGCALSLGIKINLPDNF